ncbi:hypothetical protein B6A10_12620 [Flavobacterium sp. L1I52]|uniref:histidine kinase n=1 Tax=Flavobacterium pokkalii TaxID=1940408 RepID=A0ABR7UVW7_9FLAO|nr:ATP-binding protein [Flavobacterium pokkalii]MBD0726019.1 hypothetical protein [Flavobacterium pokkalii]
MILPRLILRILSILLAVLSLTLYSCKQKERPTNEYKKDKRKIDFLIKKGELLYKKTQYDSAFFYFNKAKTICNRKEDLKEYIYSTTYLCSISQLNGDYANCEDIATEAIPYIVHVKNEKYKWRIFFILATNYAKLLDFNNAKYYHSKSLKLKIDSERRFCTLISLSYLNIREKKYNQAIKILEFLTHQKLIINDPEFQSVVMNNLGYCYFKTHKKNALHFLKKSLEIRLKNTKSFMDDWGLTANYYYLYEYYTEKKDFSKAIKYAYLLYKTAKKVDNTDDQLLALSLLVKNTEGKKSKDYALKYVKLNDSITEVRQKAKNYFAKLKYDSKKEKEENLKLKAEKELQQELERNKNIVITFIIIIIILLSAFIYYYLIQKNKKEKIQTAYNTEIRIAKKLHDELANEIFQTINFAETQDLSSPEISGKLLENLDSIYSTTRNISKENNQIETGEQFENDLKEMITSFGSKTVNIIINNLEEINWKKTSKLKKIAIYRVIQELLVNMKKHSQSNLVLISFKTQENNLLLNYYDNGKGIDFKQTKKKSGLYNIENRIEAINGTITFDSNQNKGVKTSIVIPL